MTKVFDGPRYLVAFGPKRVQHCFTDVLVLGGGVAGLRAALAVDPSLSVTVVTKDDLLTSSSQWAQGGIAGVVDPEDRFDNHVADTLVAGVGLCHDGVVDSVVASAEPLTLTPRRSTGPATYVVELASGVAALSGIEPGVRLAFDNLPAGKVAE